jgi:hypothetical protein
MTRLTAAQAKQLAGPSVDEKVDAILVAIEKIATNKGRQLRAGYDYDQDKDLWVSGGYTPTPEWKEATKILEKLGYDVDFYYNDGSQFVDMYTIIRW